MTKIQVTLTDQEAAYLTQYGNLLGYSLPKTAKFFLSKEVERIATEQFLPSHPMSEQLEAKARQAVAEYKLGKTIKVTDIAAYFDAL